MNREFVYFTEFDQRWKELGLDDEDLRELESYLSKNPESGDIIEGTGGVRKLRWNFKGRGKRGGIRTLYIDFVRYEKTYFITAYSKSDQDDLDAKQKKVIRAKIKLLTDELRKNLKKKLN
jgi:hypothetical protein